MCFSMIIFFFKLGLWDGVPFRQDVGQLRQVRARAQEPHPGLRGLWSSAQSADTGTPSISSLYYTLLSLDKTLEN